MEQEWAPVEVVADDIRLHSLFVYSFVCKHEGQQDTQNQANLRVGSWAWAAFESLHK